MAPRLLDDTTDSAHMLNGKPGKIATAMLKKCNVCALEPPPKCIVDNDVMLSRAECYYIMHPPEEDGG